jgi:hypothetical protein
MRSLKNLLVSVAALAVALGLTAAAGPAAGASNLPAARVHHKAHAAVARKVPERVSTGVPATGQPRVGCPPGTISATSQNFAGYGACTTKDVFTKVTGATIVPDVPVCNECTALLAIGMGNTTPGMDRAAVHPIAADGVGIDQAGGVNTYFTWWTLGNGAVNEVGMLVKVGDHVTATVHQSSNSYTFTVIDHTNPGNSFQVGPMMCAACAATSAEWTVARVFNGTGYYRLPNFGGWPVTGATWSISGTSGNIAALPHVRIKMVNQLNKVLVEPEALTGGGSDFKDRFIAGS